jgi:phosphoribosylformylglycinamidine cyclo-ligase
MATKGLTYADAGVNIAQWGKARERIGRLVDSTRNANVLGGFGQFGGMFDCGGLKQYENPVLVSSVDGVGTKLKIASAMGRHDTVGEDIVNHCVNDILVLGAKPLFFLDYIGVGRLMPEVIEAVVAGLSRACISAGCVLIGGETAEMPDVYHGEEYDLVGTIVGVADKTRIIDGSGIRPGDVIIGLRSSGLHTNGYTLARKIVTEVAGKRYADIFDETGESFGDALLRPHRSYAPIRVLMDEGLIKGCAHITGGGFPDNVDRVIPGGCTAVIDTRAWTPPPLFGFLRDAGGVEAMEMYRTFNMGIGMVCVAREPDCSAIMNAECAREFAPAVIGRIVSGAEKVVMEW